MHIRNAPTGLMKELGYGEGYQYAHDSPEAYIPQEYLPDELRGTAFYEPGPFGFEKEIAKRLAWWARRKAEAEEDGGEQPEREQEARPWVTPRHRTATDSARSPSCRRRRGYIRDECRTAVGRTLGCRAQSCCGLTLAAAPALRGLASRSRM